MNSFQSRTISWIVFLVFSDRWSRASKNQLLKKVYQTNIQTYIRLLIMSSLWKTAFTFRDKIIVYLWFRYTRNVSQMSQPIQD